MAFGHGNRAYLEGTLAYRTVDYNRDVDAIDNPGTGTPEVGGLTSGQGLEIVRGCAGLHLVGADVVEVAPAYDPSGNTALLGANIAYEILCAISAARSQGPKGVGE